MEMVSWQTSWPKEEETRVHTGRIGNMGRSLFIGEIATYLAEIKFGKLSRNHSFSSQPSFLTGKN
jgi:hypothetical protein